MSFSSSGIHSHKQVNGKRHSQLRTSKLPVFIRSALNNKRQQNTQRLTHTAKGLPLYTLHITCKTWKQKAKPTSRGGRHHADGDR